MYPPNPLLDTLIRHYKLLIALGCGLIVFLIFFNNTFVVVNVTGENAGKAKVELYQGARKAREVRRGLNFIRKGDYSLRASTDDTLTDMHVTLKPFRSNRANLGLAPQRQAKKVVSNSLGCVFAENSLTADSTVYSYNCKAPKNIVRYSFVDKPTSSSAFSQTLHAGTAYKNGVLGLTAGIGERNEELRLVLVTAATVIPLPYVGNPTLPSSDYSILVSTNTNGTFGEAFVVADSNKRELTYFSNIGDPQPKKLSLGEGTQKLSYAVAEDVVFVLSTQTPKEEKPVNGRDDRNPHDLPGGTLKLYSMQPDGLKETASIEVPKDFDLFGFQALNKDTLAVQRVDGDSTIYRLKENSLEVYDRIEVTDDLVPYKNGLVFRRGQDYLHYDVARKTSQLVYRSGKLEPTRLQNANGQIAFSALVPNSSIGYSFVLLDSPRSGVDIEKILAYPNEDKKIRAIDYNDTKIFVELALTSFSSDRATGQLTFDQAELDRKKGEFIQNLQLDGIDTAKYTIVTR